MDVFLSIRRKKTTIFTDAKESTTILEVKKIIEGILKIDPSDQQLYKDLLVLDDNKSLADSGFTSSTAKAQSPALIGLAVKDGDAFEELTIEEYSSPPELEDVMKQHDPSTGDQKK